MAPWDANRLERLGRWCLAAGVSSAETPERIGERALAEAERRGLAVLLQGDAGWPHAVAALDDPPGALFVWGRLPEKLGVGIVGSRHATAAGLILARQLGSDLAARGWTVISGGALGIDGAAHAGALTQAKGGGVTVAILGGGLDVLYPRQHIGLFAQIVERGGAVISEFPCGIPPWPSLFPRRNRLIAALSQAVVVVEAAQRSGSLSTARHAKKLGRTLLAVPGTPGQPTAEGPNSLLRQQQALLCTGAEDVLRALDVPPPTVPSKSERRGAAPVLSPRLAKVLDLLSVTPQPLDVIADAGNLAPGELAATVVELELLGYCGRAALGSVYRIPMRSREPSERREHP